MVGITIDLQGEKLMSRALEMSALKIADFTAPLAASAAALQKSFQMNFDEDGGLYGGWAPRKPQMRAGARIDTWPLLQKTGAMRSSFYSDITPTMATLGNHAPYFKYHQSSAPRTRLPRRVMIGITNSDKVVIQKIFQQHILDSTAELRP